jgi:hypothetical protein
LLPLEESHSGAPALEADRFILKPSVWRTRRSYASHNESGSYSKFTQACIAQMRALFAEAMPPVTQ